MRAALDVGYMICWPMNTAARIERALRFLEEQLFSGRENSDMLICFRGYLRSIWELLYGRSFHYYEQHSKLRPALSEAVLTSRLLSLAPLKLLCPQRELLSSFP